MLQFLFRHIETPEFHCRFRWQERSIAFWDNRCVQHHAMWDYFPQRRHGHRGDGPGRQATLPSLSDPGLLGRGWGLTPRAVMRSATDLPCIELERSEGSAQGTGPVASVLALAETGQRKEERTHDWRKQERGGHAESVARRPPLGASHLHRRGGLSLLALLPLLARCSWLSLLQ